MAWLMIIIASAGLVMAAAVLLFARRRGEPDTEPRCGNCRYCVHAVATFVCPECGSDLRQVGITVAPATASDRQVRAILAMAGALRRSRAIQSAAQPKSRRIATVRRRADWTPAEEQRLLRAYRSGVSVEQIAHAHGRPPRAISQHLRRLRARMPFGPNERRS